MNIVRYNIGGANTTAADEYRTGAAVPCLRQPDGSYNWYVGSDELLYNTFYTSELFGQVAM
jgi:hypothetical protein